MTKAGAFSLMAFVALWLAGCGAAEEGLGKPNIIVIYVDDLGYADVGSYGAVGVETPNVDFLAEKFSGAGAWCAAERWPAQSETQRQARVRPAASDLSAGSAAAR